MIYRSPDRNDTPPTGYISPPIRLSPRDRAIRRTPCWRAPCRAEYPGYSTVTFTITGRIVAWCHRRIHDDLGFRADVLKHGEVAA